MMMMCPASNLHRIIVHYIFNELLVSAPEVVIEVLSFATAKYDRTEKMELYKQIGVKEYILVF